MDLQSRKISFVQEFLNLQNEEIIIIFEKLLKRERNKSNNEGFNSMNEDEFYRRIDKSMDDSKSDRVLTTNELLAEIEKWN